MISFPKNEGDMMRDFYNRYKILIIALMIAAVLWLYVNYQENNLRESLDFSTNQLELDIEVINLEDDLYIKDISDQYVFIKLKGYRFFNTYSQSDFKAYIDLSEVRIGDNIRKIHIQFPEEVDIEEQKPLFIRVTIEKNKK